ncbi:DUF1684 domain-containing protein [Homoserinibacter sp. YIM 151385]|uniref:DUF1684 domain-containing protein n=1 Tax=Homoserinibacter sp. YIM 151385 TaxID=2985506 RepID=UPI0022F049A4|nr:DUF1684 domain-containing protein [Homoserinibacter sp. YIM 151385]WBU37628.1 DUF1684 domain-containing protein [Homoserinibacter sp. YIM 151385]
MSPAIRTAVDVADWRRRVFSMYERVRAEADPAAAHARWVAERDELLRSHPATPIPDAERADFAGVPVPGYDPAWRFELPVIAAEEPRRIEVETGTDGRVPFELLGRVEIPGAGSLDLWRLASYGGGLFLPVKDALAGRPGGTYGAGRYLLDTVKGADLGPGRPPETLVVDLNFAYNPSCAYDPAWACPLAQPGNRLEVEVPVGERMRAVSG